MSVRHGTIEMTAVIIVINTEWKDSGMSCIGAVCFCFCLLLLNACVICMHSTFLLY